MNVSQSSLNSSSMTFAALSSYPVKTTHSFLETKATNVVAAHLKGSVDHIICDPPFLSDDCQTKGKSLYPFITRRLLTVRLTAAMTVRWLSKSWGLSPTESPESAHVRLIICTGERMEKLVNKLYRPQGVETTTFEPVHAKGLSNEFYCYANFESEEWKWRR